MAKCILLVRVSTPQQSFDAQRNELVKFATQYCGYKKKDLIIIENIESAIKLDEEHRQGITKMKAAIEKDSSINCVCVWEASRLGRRYDVIENVRKFLIDHKVNLRFYKEGQQLFNPDGSVNTYGNLIMDVSIALAKNEMEIKISRLNREKEQKTKDGKTPTGRVLYGYYIDEEGFVQVDEEVTAPRIREIFNWAKNGKSTLWIWNECFKRGYFPYKSSRTGKNYICYLLSQPAYYGAKGKKTNTKYKAIINKKLFDEVKEAKDSRKNKPKSTSKFIAYGRSLVKYVVGDTECAMCIGHSRNSYRTTPCEALPKAVSINMNVIDYILWSETVMLYTQYLVKRGENTYRQLESEKHVLEQKIEASNKRIKSLESLKERKGVRFELGDLTLDRYKEEMKTTNDTIKQEQDIINDYKLNLIRINQQIQNIGSDHWAKIDYRSIEGITDDAERKRIIDTIITSITVSPLNNTKNGDKRYQIRIQQKVNWLYNKFFEYWQRGGVFHLIQHSFNPVGEKTEYVKDISKDIVRRFESDWSIRHKKTTD